MTKMFDFVLKGANASQLEKDIGSDMFPANEHYFGLVNVSSFVMSMLYHQIYEIFQYLHFSRLDIMIFDYVSVREHMLLKFCATSIIFL